MDFCRLFVVSSGHKRPFMTSSQACQLAKFQMLRPGTLNSSGQVYHTRSLTKCKPGQKNSNCAFNWPGKKAKLARRSLRNLASLAAAVSQNQNKESWQSSEVQYFASAVTEFAKMKKKRKKRREGSNRITAFLCLLGSKKQVFYYISTAAISR